KAAAEAAAAAAAAASLAEGNSVAGAKATAQRLAASDYGWGADQNSCLVSLWTKESGWNYKAYNANGGATGIPQALPGSKMASAGSDWATNATTQVVWGLDYIDRAYGSPCAAWSHSQAVNWY
ncbi:phospholipase, partial [Frigoribacterium faeni]|nr:phospholipase [Frigoribacterium faeni]